MLQKTTWVNQIIQFFKHNTYALNMIFNDLKKTIELKKSIKGQSKVLSLSLRVMVLYHSMSKQKKQQRNRNKTTKSNKIQYSKQKKKLQEKHQQLPGNSTPYKNLIYILLFNGFQAIATFLEMKEQTLQPRKEQILNKQTQLNR